MAHHQGMSLIAINNVINNFIMQERFHKDVYVQSAEVLLQEKVPGDIIYTKDSMEITEPMTAKALYDNKVNLAYIESNNGGRGFARNVGNILRNQYNSNRCIINWFHQSQNKNPPTRWIPKG